jgi:tetratricopeptide (TPR) repeat protein
MGRGSQFNLGTALLRAGHYEEAEAQLQYVRELNPADTEEVDQRLALAQLLAGRPSDALSTAQSLSHVVERLFVEALAYFAAGEIEQSDQAVVALSEYDDVASAVRLAEIHSYRDDPEAALKWLDAACQRLTTSTPWRYGPLMILVATHDPFLLRHQDDPGFMARLEEVRREMLAIRDAGFVKREAA